MGKTGIMIAIVVVLCCIGFGGCNGLMWVSYNNKDAELRNALTSQQDVCKTVFDNTWKIIAQQAKVPDKYKDGFKEVYEAIMANRADKDGLMMKWVKEQNPQFDSNLYTKLMDSIEVQLNVFTREQKKLRSIKQEHDNLITKAPSLWYVTNTIPVEVQLVTSTKTEKAFTTGKDDDVSL